MPELLIALIIGLLLTLGSVWGADTRDGFGEGREGDSWAPPRRWFIEPERSR